MKPKGVLTFDLDGWRTFYSRSHLEKDNLLELGIPGIIEFFEQNNPDVTFFVVGQNARDFPHLHTRLKEYEIGNHTYSHPRVLTQFPPPKKSNEVTKAHEIIADIFSYLMPQETPIVLNFHAKDFVNIKLPRKRLMNRHRSLDVTESFLQLIVEKCEVMSIREYYGKKDQTEN